MMTKLFNGDREEKTLSSSIQNLMPQITFEYYQNCIIIFIFGSGSDYLWQAIQKVKFSISSTKQNYRYLTSINKIRVNASEQSNKDLTQIDNQPPKYVNTETTILLIIVAAKHANISVATRTVV